MKKKCVCISCFNYYDTRISHVKRYMESQGVDVLYVISDYNHFEKKYYEVDYPNTIQVHVPKYKKNISLARIFSQLTFSRKASEILNKEHPDIVYCMFPPNSLIGKVIKYKERSNCKVVFDGYDMWPESMPVSKRLKKILSPIFNRWAGLRDNYIEGGNLIVVVSQAMLDMVNSKWKDVPIKLLLPSISTSEFPSYTYDVKSSISFCYLGNINHITDIDLLVEVLGRVAQSKEVKLHIIGEGIKLNELLEKASSKGVKCITHGVIMDAKVKREVYSQCNLAVNLPREEINSTMSLKSVEYLGVGLPFINSAGGDSWKIVDDFNVGININKDNIDKSVEEILSLNSDKLSQMSKNCAKYCENRFKSQDMGEIFKGIL